MKNRVEIVFDDGVNPHGNDVTKDFSQVLNQYHDYRKTTKKYFKLLLLGLLGALTIGVGYYVKFDKDRTFSQNTSDINYEYGPFEKAQSYFPIIEAANIPNKDFVHLKAEPEKSKLANSIPLPPDENQAKKVTDRESNETPVFINAPARPLEGFPRFYEYLANNLTYPEEKRKDSVNGLVKVVFTINADSSITDIKVMKSLGEAFDSEAIRLIKGMPQWQPAIKKNRPAISNMIVPIRFKILTDE